MKKNCLQCKKTFSKPYTRSVRDFLERAKFCSLKCRSIHNKGKCPEKLLDFHLTRRGIPAYNRKPLTVFDCAECSTHIEKLTGTVHKKSKIRFCSKDCANKFKDQGKTKIQKRIRQRTSYKNWRTSVFERDNYTCQSCNKRGES